MATPEPVASMMYRLCSTLPLILRTVMPAFAATSSNQAGGGCSVLAGYGDCATHMPQVSASIMNVSARVLTSLVPPGLALPCSSSSAPFLLLQRRRGGWRRGPSAHLEHRKARRFQRDRLSRRYRAQSECA